MTKTEKKVKGEAPNRASTVTTYELAPEDRATLTAIQENIGHLVRKEIRLNDSDRSAVVALRDQLGVLVHLLRQQVEIPEHAARRAGEEVAGLRTDMRQFIGMITKKVSEESPLLVEIGESMTSLKNILQACAYVAAVGFGIVADAGVCRICGCTDESGCVGPGGVCSWTDELRDICSECVRKAKGEGDGDDQE